MISFKTEFDFTNVRKYHPEIEIVAETIEGMGQPITSVAQIVRINITEQEWTTFLENYEQTLISYHVTREHSLPLLLLLQKTYSDIEQGEEQLAEHGNMLYNLNFLKEILTYQESKPGKDGLPELSLSIEHKRRSSTLNDPAIATFIIKQLIKIFKDKSYNFALAGMLENMELTAANVEREIDKYTYRNTDIPYYCTAQTADRICQYLNAHTTFTKLGKNLYNEQARFIYDVLELFKLTPYLLKRRTVPRIANDLPAFKTQVIKDLIRNHKLYK